MAKIKKIPFQEMKIPEKFWVGLWNPITGKLPARRVFKSQIYRDRSTPKHEF